VASARQRSTAEGVKLRSLPRSAPPSSCSATAALGAAMAVIRGDPEAGLRKAAAPGAQPHLGTLARPRLEARFVKAPANMSTTTR
jgi:hypothetical protein